MLASRKTVGELGVRPHYTPHNYERNIMQPICDICGKHLTPTDINTIRAASVVDATSKGYVPSKLPPTWKPECEMLGITIATHWGTVVKMNSTVDWGLCKDCFEDVERFKPVVQSSEPPNQNTKINTTMSDGEILVTAAVYCALIMGKEGQSAILSFGGKELRVFDIMVVFNSTAKDLLTEREVLNIANEAIRPSRIESVSKDDRLGVISDALMIIARPQKVKAPSPQSTSTDKPWWRFW